LFSSATTFVAMFTLTALMFIVESGTIEWTISFWMGVLSLSARAAIKAVAEYGIPLLKSFLRK